MPTHQLAGSPSANAVITTAIAAGLKMCLLWSANRYFEAIASTAAQPSSCKPSSDPAGSRINARISAVMKDDSTLVGTSKAHARIAFAAQQMKARNAAETISHDRRVRQQPDLAEDRGNDDVADQHVERQPVHRDAVEEVIDGRHHRWRTNLSNPLVKVAMPLRSI